jgi:hypothetical protein
MTNDQLLEAIAQYGSVRKAAIALLISPESISKRFRKLPDDDPLKQKYNELTGKKGRPRIYPEGVEGDRERILKAVRKYRSKKQ